jgi:ABC-type transport system involved in multi-copper enzyme maturation permease subunit
MIGVLKAELYKSIYNKFLYLAITIIVCVMGALSVFTTKSERLQYQMQIMPDIFLVVVCIAAGSIVAQEYSLLTIKDMLITCSKRKDIFISKVIICIISITIIFFIYSLMLILSSDSYKIINILFAQFLVVLSQSIITIFLSILLQSFSTVSLITIIMFFLYHIFLLINEKSIIYQFLRCSYLNLFYSSTDFLKGYGDIKYYLYFLMVSIVFLAISYFIFLKQEL